MVLAIRPVPTREIRFRWRYQQSRVILIGIGAVAMDVGLVFLARYIIDAHITPRPKGWLLSGIVYGTVVGAFTRVHFGGVEDYGLEQQGATTVRTIARFLSRVLYEMADDATEEDVENWLIKRTPKKQQALRVARAVARHCEPTAGEQELIRECVRDIQPANDPHTRANGADRLRGWATEKIVLHRIMLPKELTLSKSRPGRRRRTSSR